MKDATAKAFAKTLGYTMAHINKMSFLFRVQSSDLCLILSSQMLLHVLLLVQPL